MADTILDVFNQDAFSVINLTDAINKAPFVPGRAGVLIPWATQGIETDKAVIEEVGGSLKLLNPLPRGGAGETFDKDKRTVRILQVPHYQVNDAIYADEVQGVRAFGQTSVVQTIVDKVNERNMQIREWQVAPTLEYQALGAVKGIILNGDGSTLYNLFTEFGVSQEAEIDFDLDAGSPASGVLRKACAAVVRKIADNLGAVPFSAVYAFCGNNFFDDLLAHKEVVESYKNTPMAQVLREGYVVPGVGQVYGAFEFGGIVWENYRGAVGGSAFVDTDKCHIFPVGTPGLWRRLFAPADYIETVNTTGRPFYAKQLRMRNDKGVEIEVQTNALHYCTRPKVLMKGKRT